RAQASTAPGSSSFCPACGKPIDALRAGQVAILDGAFRYFCNTGCKNAYVDVVSKRSMLDVAITVEPPPVTLSASSAQPLAPSLVRVEQPFAAASGVREQCVRSVATVEESVPTSTGSGDDGALTADGVHEGRWSPGEDRDVDRAEYAVDESPSASEREESP